MNEDNTQYFSMLFGLEYQKSFVSKPQFFDSFGNLRVEEVLTDLAFEYRQMKDDKLIDELIVLKKQTDTALKSDNESQFVDLQIKRQILTNAYALNHGASNISIKQISVLGDDILYKLRIVYVFVKVQESLFDKYPSAFSSITDDMQSQIMQNSYLSNLDTKTKSLFERLFYSMYSFRKFFSLRACTKLIYHQTFPNHFALSLAEVYISHFGLNEFQKLVDEYNSINGHFENMVNKFQMPPYGVALALSYEDDGQRVLPWHGKLSDHTISKLRLKMHAYVHKQVDAYNAILAAYCNMCFNDEPTIAMVRLEFDNVPHNKGKYSKDTSKKFSTYKRYVEQGWTTQIDNLVINEPFYSLYCELKGILKST